MCQDMRSDVDLLNTLLNEAPTVVDRLAQRPCILSAKLIARWTDRSIQTVSDYRIGRTNIPVGFWRMILSRHLDVRILNLIAPDDIVLEMTSIEAPPQQTTASFFAEALKNEQEHAKMQQYIAEVLADGRIDELDAATVKQYDDAFHSHRLRDAELHRGIVAKFNHAMAVKGLSR